MKYVIALLLPFMFFGCEKTEERADKIAFIINETAKDTRGKINAKIEIHSEDLTVTYTFEDVNLK